MLVPSQWQRQVEWGKLTIGEGEEIKNPVIFTTKFCRKIPFGLKEWTKFWFKCVFSVKIHWKLNPKLSVVGKGLFSCTCFVLTHLRRIFRFVLAKKRSTAIVITLYKGYKMENSLAFSVRSILFCSWMVIGFL